MPDLCERRIDAWTAFAADPAVRAAERAIVTGSVTILADTLALSTAAESRVRLAGVLDLKRQAERDPRRREAYQQAADELRNWAAGVYLATVRDPQARLPPPADRPGGADRTSVGKHEDSYTEESISLRRSPRRRPFSSLVLEPRRRRDGARARWQTEPYTGTLHS